VTSIDILDLLSVDSLQAEDDHIQMSPPVSMDQRCHNNVTHVGTRNLRGLDSHEKEHKWGDIDLGIPGDKTGTVYILYYAKIFLEHPPTLCNTT